MNAQLQGRFLTLNRPEPLAPIELVHPACTTASYNGLPFLESPAALFGMILGRRIALLPSGFR
jgi:hypothetical protein